MSNKLLKYVIYGGLFAVPFVPFIIDTSLFFPFITGKAFVFRTIVLIIAACYAVLAIRDESYRPKLSWVSASLLLFMVIIGLADIFAVNPFKAFWSNFERMEGFVAILHFFLYFLVLSSVLKTQEMWNGLLATTVGASFIMSVYSLFQIAGKIAINQGGVRVDGTLGNAAYLGIYMVFHIFFASLLFFRSRYTWQKVLLAISIALNLIVLYYTATRGAILGLLGGVLVSFLFLVFKSEKGDKIRKFALGGVVALVVGVGLFALAKDTSFVQSSPVLARFAELSPSEFQNQGRYYVWPIAIKGFLERPILGWGQEGFNFVFNKYYDPRMYNQEPWFDRAHNTFLDWLVAGGVPGLASYLLILFSVVVYVFKAEESFLRKEDKAVILGLLSAYVFNNLFVFDQISSYILFFTLLAYVHAHAPETHIGVWQKISDKARNIFTKEQHKPIFESVVVILAVSSIYVFVFVPWRHNNNLLSVLRLNNEGKIGNLEDYTKPIRDKSLGFSESLEHVSQTAMAIASADAPEDFKKSLFAELDGAFASYIEDVPRDARYRLFYGMFLSRYGWYGRAVEQLQKAIELSPNKQTIYFELANNLVLDNKPQEALEVAKKAYELEPSFVEARMVYGIVAGITGNRQLSEEIFSGVEESRLIFDDRYMSALVSFGETQKIIDISKRRTELDPSNLQHRITLAAAYLNAARRQEAISAIEEIIKIDPTFKERGDYYISEIRAGRNP